jgi:hypothetical protein
VLGGRAGTAEILRGAVEEAVQVETGMDVDVSVDRDRYEAG